MEKYSKIYYELIGRGKKPTILFLHGFMGSRRDWADLTEDLSSHFCCIVVDLPGHGKSQLLDDDEDYTMENTASYLVELLEELGIKQCILCGYSMGARVALYLGMNYPKYFLKLILEGVSPGLKTRRERGERMAKDEALALKLQTDDFGEFLENWYDMPLFKTLKNHQNFDKILNRRLENNPKKLAKSLLKIGLGSQVSLWEKWTLNQIPTLLIVGEEDEKFRNIAEEMVNGCKYAKLEIIENAGHNVHLEEKIKFVESMKNFISIMST